MDHLVRGVSLMVRWAFHHSAHCRVPLVIPALMVCCGLTSCGFSDLAANNESKLGTLTITVKGSSYVDVGSLIQAEATVRDALYTVMGFSWNVTTAGTSVEVTTSGTKDKQVTFQVETAGTYQIHCTASFDGNDNTLKTHINVYVEEPSVKKLTHTIRILPPPQSGLSPTDHSIEVGMAEQLDRTLTIEPARQVNLVVQDPEQSSLLIPTYVRFFRTGADPLPFDVILDQGQGTLVMNGTVHALFLPLGDTYPALLKTNQNTTTLGDPWTVLLDKGVPISGVVMVGEDPIAEAYVTIHTQDEGSGISVPSTGSRTSLTGAFTIQAHPGPASLTIVPRENDRLPAAIVDALTLAETVLSDWKFVYQSTGAAEIAGQVVSADGKTPAAWAKILMTLESTEPVGTLTIEGKDYPAMGRHQVDLTTDEQGGLRLMSSATGPIMLPAGKYLVEGWPGDKAAADQGYFQDTIDLLPGTENKDLILQLAQRIQVKGLVRTASYQGVRARITASSDVSSFSTRSNDTGHYELLIDRNQIYSLMIRPMSELEGMIMSRIILPEVPISGLSTTIEDAIAQPAVRLTGYVKDTGQAAIAGALIRIWCSDPACASTEILDETQSAIDGYYELRVPPSSIKQ